jgi:2-polyprenyl-6-methoxyphenol hydroxylase-like FAD-dependent oxidoreductase
MATVEVPADVPTPLPDPGEAARDVTYTGCCVVGAGPGGMMLALLLGRRGVQVTLLEAHRDLDRQFRGDTLHPVILEILDQVGLADGVLRLPHFRIRGATLYTPQGEFTPFDFRMVRSRFPFIVFIHQAVFLDFLATEARKLPSFRLVFGANVQRLVEEGGVVRGVRYRSADGWHEVRAPLTVGADGRFSRLRHLAGFEARPLAPPFELLWFRLPRLSGDEERFATAPVPTPDGLALRVWADGHPRKSAGVLGRFGGGRVVALFDRFDHWQVGYFFPPGQYPALKAAGVGPLRSSIIALEPRLEPHLEGLTDWHQFFPLSVAMGRCRRWYRPGLLLIGDAAHPMTPAAGAGIKYAIEDAVVAANVLAGPLRAGRVGVGDLARVQQLREWSTRFIQALGAFAQKRLFGFFLRSARVGLVPGWVRLLFGVPGFRPLLARMVGIGLWRVRVKRS